MSVSLYEVANKKLRDQYLVDLGQQSGKWQTQVKDDLTQAKIDPESIGLSQSFDYQAYTTLLNNVRLGQKSITPDVLKAIGIFEKQSMRYRADYMVDTLRYLKNEYNMSADEYLEICLGEDPEIIQKRC